MSVFHLQNEAVKKNQEILCSSHDRYCCRRPLWRYHAVIVLAASRIPWIRFQLSVEVCRQHWYQPRLHRGQNYIAIAASWSSSVPLRRNEPERNTSYPVHVRWQGVLSRRTTGMEQPRFGHQEHRRYFILWTRHYDMYLFRMVDSD